MLCTLSTAIRLMGLLDYERELLPQLQHPFREWVYNEADIDGAKVVWAREMDRAHNSKLLRYFKDWYVWLVEVDERHSSPELVPYHLGMSP